MSEQWISPALRAAVRERARGGCEYCQVPGNLVWLSHQPDHIIAEQHGGEMTLANLAWSCAHCNLHKGPNIASVDPETAERIFLFHPREQNWREHFRVDEGRIVPLTAVGRATARLLKFNVGSQLAVRRRWWRLGRYPD